MEGAQPDPVRTGPSAVEGPAAGPGGTGAALVPDEVARLAAQRGFGALLDVRREVPMTTALVKGWGIAAASFAMMWLLSSLGGGTSMFSAIYSVLHFVAVFFFFMFVWGVAYGIRGLVVGSRSHYLYAGGLVHSRRSGPQAVAWPEVGRLTSVYNRRGQGGEGKVLGYKVEAQGGTSFMVPLLLVNGRDAFVDRLMEHLRAHDRPIY
jgi:hypothetical protein